LDIQQYLTLLSEKYRKGDDTAMKKYKLLVIGIAALFLTTVIVLNVPGRAAYSMGSECAEDGSCCEDENACACD
jgi:hypothetical protein